MQNLQEMKGFTRRNAVPALLERGTAFSVFVGFMHGKCIYTEKRSKIFTLRNPSVQHYNIYRSKLVLICKKQYTDMLKPEGFLIPETYQRWYNTDPLHKLFVGEILAAYERTDA